MKELKQLFKTQEDAAERVAERIKTLFPVGKCFYFKKGRATVSAEVTGHKRWEASYSLRVRNIATGREYWLDLGESFIEEIAELNGMEAEGL